jgi:type I restriction enzyme S subunit
MVPEGWNRRKLDDVAELIGGTTPSKAFFDYWDGEIPWATPSDITSLSASTNYIYNTSSKITKLALEETSVRLLSPGSVLMTSRATIGEVVINMVPMATNQGFCNFIPNSSIHAEYLANLLKFSKNKLKRLAAGSTFLEISKKTLKNIEIDLPPLPEQKKIAAILSSVDDTIQATQAVIDQTRTVKQGLLQQLLTRGIGHTRFKQTEIGEIPEEWKIVQLSNIFQERRETSSNLEQYNLCSLTIENGIIEKPERYNRSFLLKNKQDNQYRIVYPGDFVFNPMNLRWGAIAISNFHDPIAVSAYYNILTPQRDMISPGLLLSILQSRPLLNVYEMVGKGTLIEKKRVHLREFLKINIRIPPLKEGGRIEQIFQSFDRNLNNLLEEKNKMEQIKRGLMQDLLTGRVRVKLDEVNTT